MFGIPITFVFLQQLGSGLGALAPVLYEKLK